MRNAKALGCGLLAVGISWLLFTAQPVAGAARTHLLEVVWRKAARTLSDNSRTYTVTATTYEAVVNQTDDEPFITADNSRIPRSYGSHTRWLALSRDLLRPWGGPFEFGDKVRVRGISPALDGVYTVHDTMNRRYHHCLDVLVHPREHVTIARAGVKIQRLSSSHSSRSTSILLTSRRSSRKRVVAHQRTRAHQVVAQHSSRKSRRGRSRATLVAATLRPAKRTDKHLSPRSKHNTPLARQRHKPAKQQVATLPKHARKRVVAQVHHSHAA
jgi:hypothetical protein